jgi:D-alanyl-D-alanine carboxypeptidase
LTVRHLLTHTGGVRNYWDDAFVEQVVVDFNRRWQPEELVAIAASGAPAGAPDDGYAIYSNTNYTLLGLIIENATGSTLATVLRQRIFTPLGMQETASWEENTLRPQAAGYFPEGGELMDVSGLDLSVSWAAGGLVSTAEDVSLLTRGILAGKLLSDASRTAMTSNFRPMKGKSQIDYAMGVGRLTAFDPPLLGHMGDGPGYGSLSFYDPSSGTSVVVLINMSSEAHIETLIQVMDLLQR